MRARFEYELRAQREDFLIQTALTRGRELPAWYLDAPPKISGDEFYFDAWRQLSTCRAYGEMIGPIPWTAIKEYADHYSLEGESEVFIQAIVEMDAAWLDVQRKEMEKQRADHERKAKRELRG